MNNIDQNMIAELLNHFSPKSLIVEALPNIRTVKDKTEALIKNSDNTYNTYKAVAGSWIQTNSNITNDETVTAGGSGGSGTDYSGDIAANLAKINITIASIAANVASIFLINAALAALPEAPSYVEISANYILETAVGVDKKIIAIKNISAVDRTVSCNAAETIDDEISQDLGEDDCLMVMSNNTNWIIV